MPNPSSSTTSDTSRPGTNPANSGDATATREIQKREVPVASTERPSREWQVKG